MKIRKPAYYDAFHCLAARCPDSCCQEWCVDIDEDTAAYYRSLPGTLGDRLRQVLAQEDGGAVMTVENGRCPMWREDGLCRIQAELGENALSRVCKTYPRLLHDYGDFQEWGLELSCPEAARLILSAPDAELAEECSESIAPTGEGDYDRETMALLLSAREEARKLLQFGTPGQALTAVLLHACGVQAALDGGEAPAFSPETVLSLGNEGVAPDYGEFYGVFRELEILTPRWREKLKNPMPRKPGEEARALMGYFLNRYYLQAVSDFDLVDRVKFWVISCLAIENLPGDIFENAQLYSKEIENDPDNVDALLDAAYGSPAFTDRKLLGMLL